MTVVIICLLIAGFVATMVSKWRHARDLANDIAVGKEQERIDSLKSAINATQKGIDNASKDYNSVYDAYKRKYHPSPRDDNSKPK